MNLRHACRKLSGVFCSPKPKTSAPCSRRRDARRVKSLSEETRQKPSNRPLCKRSMASITKAMSDAFFRQLCSGRVGKLLVGVDRVFLEDVHPRLQALAREITIDPPDTRLTELGDLLKKPGGDAWRRAVSIDEDRQSARAAFFRHVWTSAVRARDGSPMPLAVFGFPERGSRSGLETATLADQFSHSLVLPYRPAS